MTIKHVSSTNVHYMGYTIIWCHIFKPLWVYRGLFSDFRRLRALQAYVEGIPLSYLFTRYDCQFLGNNYKLNCSYRAALCGIRSLEDLQHVLHDPLAYGECRKLSKSYVALGFPLVRPLLWLKRLVRVGYVCVFPRPPDLVTHLLPDDVVLT